MAQATTKEELLSSANNSFQKLFCAIDSLTKQQQEQNFTFNKEDLTNKDNALHWERDNNIRDVLTHLYEWHQLMLDFVLSNKKGLLKPFLPAPYTWTTYQQMNVEFFKKHQNTDYEKAKQMLKDSHAQVVSAIESFDDNQLFEKKHFAWTGSTSLARYFHSSTTAHYEWAIKKLKAYQKSLSN